MMAAVLLKAAQGSLRAAGVRRLGSLAAESRHLLILGPPGGGKGTISKRITADFDIPAISSGDMIRSQIAQQTELGIKAKAMVDAGSLVPDSVVTDLILSDLAGRTGPWMLDGFPRTVAQAHSLNQSFQIDHVIALDIPFDTIVERLKARWCHLPSGRIYNLDFNPPKVPGKDNETGEDLVQREDDKPETVRHRLATYQRETEPILEIYEKLGIVAQFQGTETDVIYPEISKFLSSA